MRRGRWAVGLLLCVICFLLPLRAKAEEAHAMTDFEQQIVETGLRLLPYDHPFVLAYEKAHGVDIDSYVAQIKGVTVSGVPFQFGGNGRISGFGENWWASTGDAQYPVHGLDCAEYIAWIYYQLGYTVNDSSAGQFLSGVSGVPRKLPGVREHLVIPSFEEAMIGDVAYNSQNYSYRSGHGSHTQLYIGTARKLGLVEALQEYWPDFPPDAHLVLECGWSDGRYYYDLMKKLKVRHARSSLAGVGVQFFTSVKSGKQMLYQCPNGVFKWQNPDTGHTFRIESRLEAQKRPLQYKAKSGIENIINLSRPIIRPDE